MASAEKTVPVAADWVQRMIDSPGRSGQLSHGDHSTHYLEWGESSNPRVLLLLHGFLGHAHWWDFIAPWFAHEYRVLAIDFSGMGDSSPREKYSKPTFVGQVGAMLQMLGSTSVTLVGHSFGGRVTVLAAHQYPQFLKRAIIVDSKLGFVDRPARGRFATRAKRVYPDLATACRHFRLVPDEPPIPHRILQHIAAHSLRSQGDGYVWKFDGALAGGLVEPTTEGELLGEIELPMDFIAGEFSAVVPGDLAQRIAKALRKGRGPIIIPAAFHHIPIDEPLALVAALRALLS